MNQKGIVLSGLIYALLFFFLLLLISFLIVLWYRQIAINNLAEDANKIYDDISLPFTTDFNYEKGVNAPKLATGMTPIKWDGSEWIDTVETDAEWFSYTTTDKKWANAKTADGSMWVWIPRYAYQIATEYHTSTAGTINIKFLIDRTNNTSDGTTVSEEAAYSDTSQTNFIAHPAFTFGNIELTGIWVAKFEASVSNTSDLCYTSPDATNCNVVTNNLKIVPNVIAWRYIQVGNVFTVCRNMEINSSYGWGTSGTGIDTHLLKNNEWGAITYLSQSLYGKNDEIWINNSSTYTTGCAGNSVSEEEYSGCENSYDTINGVKASTTGTIYGIYDMAGGAWEYQAAYLNNDHANLNSYGSNIISETNRYKNIYSVGATDDEADNYALIVNNNGDAMYETSSSSTESTSWYGDFSVMAQTDKPWILRGGSQSQEVSTGIFAFHSYTGAAVGTVGFRPIILISDGL